MDKWIKCSDQMPEIKKRQGMTESDYVLICTGLGVIKKACCMRSWQGFYIWYNENRDIEYNVVAWMPLPEPYKESENKE